MSQSDGRRRPRQKRSLEKVEHILNAVDELVAAQDIDSVTTTRIAEATGFAVGTIYQYYSNRTDLLMAAYDRTHDAIVERVLDDAAMANSITDGIERMIRCYVRCAQSQPGYLNLHRFAHMNQSLESAGDRLETAIGDVVDQYVASAAPQATRLQKETGRKIIVNLFSVLVDAVLLEQDDHLQEQFLDELVAHVQFALEQVAVKDG